MTFSFNFFSYNLFQINYFFVFDPRQNGKDYVIYGINKKSVNYNIMEQ